MQTDILGNRTYNLLLRDHFASSRRCAVESLWFHEDRGLYGRALHKLVAWRLPILSHANQDFSRARAEWVFGQVGARLARRKLRQAHYDVMHFHTYVHAFGAASLMRKVPSVISTDLTCYQAARENAAHAWTYRPNILMEKKIFAATRHIVVFSNWARGSVINDHGITPDKVSVVYPGVPLPRFPEVDWSTKPAIPRLLFVGGDFVRKGGEEVLEVFLASLADRAELHLVTHYPLRCDHPRVIVHRNVQAYSPEWHDLFRSAFCFVMPTRAEAFGNVFVEASAYGLPVIATRIAAIPEIIEEGVSGLLIEPGDRAGLLAKLSALLDDPAKAEKMGGAGRKIAFDKFDAGKNFNELEDIFVRLAS